MSEQRKGLENICKFDIYWRRKMLDVQGGFFLIAAHLSIQTPTDVRFSVRPPLWLRGLWSSCMWSLCHSELCHCPEQLGMEDSSLRQEMLSKPPLAWGRVSNMFCFPRFKASIALPPSVLFAFIENLYWPLCL